MPQEAPIDVGLLDGIRVLDLSEGIPGAYCTKLLLDAGAEVVKVERPGGDPLRRWSASGADIGEADGALFRFLAAGKRSVVGDLGSADVAVLLGGADLVVEHGVLGDGDLDRLSRDHPRLSVLSITAFGRTGPWRDRPATEFTLQAMCGSTAGRGTAEREPVSVGGRLGEWTAGTYGAVAALAALRGARRRGSGERIDLSVLECMTAVMAGAAPLLASLAGTADSPLPPRTVELPSVEPTADGYIGFCTVTAQQFRDFLVLIERPDLLEDEGLARFPTRYARRDEFLPMVRQWTTARTSAEIEELAALLRIPVAPVGRPHTVTTMAQFVARGVYRPGADGVPVPRPPYMVDAAVPGTPGAPAPRLGEHSAGAPWRDRLPEVPAGAPVTAGDVDTLPLAGLRVLDLTAFWAGPAATLVLAALGAEVVKVESTRRPDGMRFSSAKPPDAPAWWEWGSFFLANNANKRGITLDLSDERGRELLLDLVAESDAVIENFSPRVLDQFGITWEAVHAANPAAVMVRMPAFGLDGPWRDRTGFAQTMEQVSGMAWMTGFADGPPIIPRGPCDPLAGLHAAFALLACLAERDRSGRGHFAECAMVEAALNVAAEVVLEYGTYGAALARDGNRGPVSAPQGLYRCPDDPDGRENWLALAVPDDAAWRGLVAALGSPEWATATELAGAAGRRAAHGRIDAELASWAAAGHVHQLVELLVDHGVPAARVTEGARALAHPQLRARGFVETFDHPVVGRRETQGMPFRFSSHPGPWFTTPAPTLGQHTAAVLHELLGLGDAEIAALEADGVIGDTPRWG